VSERADAVAGALPDPERLGRLEALTDRLNPILVRELQQALAGRAFVATLFLTVVAVVLLAMGFAWIGEAGDQRGREAFAWCIAAIAPIALLIVPLQAFTGMRQEVGGGTAEQLLMTRLRPSRIVLGKILAGLAQFGLFLGVFAPLVALTFLLRGIDVPTIALTLFFALLANVAANAFAIALASVGGAKTAQQATQALASAGLFIATFTAMGGSYELPHLFASLLRDGDFWPIFLSLLGSFAVGIWLCAMIATTALAHGYENRSSPFRAFAVGMLLLLAVWLVAALEPRHLGEAAGYVSASFALCLAPFWLWAACEEAGMSPRVRSLVPRRGGLALLAVPFLPGGGRGLLFGLLLAALGVAVGGLLPLAVGERPDRAALRVCAIAWLYVPLVQAIAQAMRNRLPRGRRFSLGCFVVTLLAVLVLAVLPLLYHLLTDTRIEGWHLGHLFNPIFTVVDGQPRREALLALGLLAGLGLLVNLPPLWRGIQEVRRASAQRRQLGV
jgi:ABC-type transport system involved in cytochrome c biogenesis permease component